MDYTPCVRVFGVFLMRLQQSRLQSQQTWFLLYYIKVLQELQILLQTCIAANELFAVCFDVFLQEVYSSLTRADLCQATVWEDDAVRREALD